MQVVDFKDLNTYKNILNHVYTIRIDSCIKTSIIVKFPNHPKKELHQIDTKSYWSVASLNKDINNLLRESTLQHSLTINGVCFKNIYGNVYLVWASIKKENENGIEVENVKESPLIIITNKYGGYKHFYLFFDKKVKHVAKGETHDFILHFPIKTEIFCMESTKKTEFLSKIKIIHDKDSQSQVENEIHTSQMCNLITSSEEDESCENDNNNKFKE